MDITTNVSVDFSNINLLLRFPWSRLPIKDFHQHEGVFNPRSIIYDGVQFGVQSIYIMMHYGMLSIQNWTRWGWIFTPPQNRGGVIFSLQFVCVCVCVCVSVCLFVYTCVRFCLWTKFQSNGCTVFAKGLLTALAQTLLKLVTLGQRSRSQWRNTHFFFIVLC